MTPAIKLLEKHNITHTVHQYTHDRKVSSFGQEAAAKLGVPATRVYKTLVLELDNHELVVGIVPISNTLNPRAVAKLLAGKKAIMADPQAVSRSTGYVLGGVSPLAQKKRLRTVIDASALELRTLYVSAGRRGLEIELSPRDLASLCRASFGNIMQARANISTD